MSKSRRIGPQMAMAAQIVADSPGCTMLHVAGRLHRACRNGRNNALGYNPVHRAVAAGLILARRGKGNSYTLYPLGFVLC